MPPRGGSHVSVVSLEDMSVPQVFCGFLQFPIGGRPYFFGGQNTAGRPDKIEVKLNHQESSSSSSVFLLPWQARLQGRG